MEHGADSILAETTTKNIIDISCLDVNFELKYDAVSQSGEIVEDIIKDEFTKKGIEVYVYDYEIK